MPRKQRFKPSRKPKPITEGNGDQQTRTTSGDDRMIGVADREREHSGIDRANNVDDERRSE